MLHILTFGPLFRLPSSTSFGGRPGDVQNTSFERQNIKPDNANSRLTFLRLVGQYSASTSSMSAMGLCSFCKNDTYMSPSHDVSSMYKVEMLKERSKTEKHFKNQRSNRNLIIVLALLFRFFGGGSLVRGGVEMARS